MSTQCPAAYRSEGVTVHCVLEARHRSSHADGNAYWPASPARGGNFPSGDTRSPKVAAQGPRSNGGGMPKLVQAKHVPELALLLILREARDGRVDALSKLAETYPQRVILARVHKLIKRRLVGFQPHAPGDLMFWITTAGTARIIELQEQEAENGR